MDYVDNHWKFRRKDMLRTALAFCFVLLATLIPTYGAVNSIVIGASSRGLYTGAFGDSLGRYVDSIVDEAYGLGVVSVDEFVGFGDLTEEYPDPLGGLLTGKQAELYLSLDISMDKELRLVASSTLEPAINPSVKNYHSAGIDFSIAADSDVTATLDGSVSAFSSLSIFDSNGTSLWSKGDSTDPFSMAKGAYSIQYTVFAEIGRLHDSLDLKLAFTLQSSPPPPTDPSPPPGPESVVPEPTSCLILGVFAAGLIGKRYSVKRKNDLQGIQSIRPRSKSCF
jgi:hypothetical protein